MASAQTYLTGILLGIFVINMQVFSQEKTHETKKHLLQRQVFNKQYSSRWFIGPGGGFGWTIDNVSKYFKGSGWSYELNALYMDYKHVDVRRLIGIHLFRYLYTLNKNALSDWFDVSSEDIQMQPGRTDLTGLMLCIGAAVGLSNPPNINHFLSVTMGFGVYYHRRQGSIITDRNKSTRVPGLNETRFALAFSVGYRTDLNPSLQLYLDSRLHMVIRAFDPGEGGVGVINFGLVAGFLVGL